MHSNAPDAPRFSAPPCSPGRDWAKKPLEGQRFFLQPVRAYLFQQMPQMIQPHGAFQTMALSAAAETLRASSNLHVSDFADQRVPAIEDMPALHHAGANAPSRKKRQKAAMGKLFFIQKHRPPAGLARVIHQENQRLRENLLQLLRQGNAAAPFGILGIVAQGSAGVIHNAGNRQPYAVKLPCGQRMLVQILADALLQISEGRFRVMIQLMLHSRYGEYLRTHQIRQRKRNSVRPHGDGKDFSFIRKLKILGASSAVGIVARIPADFRMPR